MSPLLRPTSSVRGQSYTVDLESARKVLPGASQLSLQVLCGESMHPDVDAFIKSTLGSEAPCRGAHPFLYPPFHFIKFCLNLWL